MRPPPVEIGARAGGTALLVGGMPAYGGVLTVHLNPRIAIEGNVALAPPVRLSSWSGTALLYEAGVRGRIIRTRAGLEWFWTAGGTGLFARSRTSGEPIRLFNLWTIDRRSRASLA